MDDLSWVDDHLEMAYEDANGSELPEHNKFWDEGSEDDARLNALRGWN